MRRALAVVAVVVLVGGGWAAFEYFEVQKLWQDDEVSEAAPVFTGPRATASGTGQAPTSTPVQVTEPVAVASGTFRDRSHPTVGRALVLSDGSAQRFLRFEGFETDNGPDLNVYLSTAAPDAPAGRLDDDFVDLGNLKGNVGDQNYEIPAEVDLERYRTVVIWCVRFSVAFGTAELAPT